MNSLNILGIVPARYSSSRFPGKPLADIQGKPMVVWVAEQALKSTYLKNVVVATDDERIEKACKSYGIATVMTNADHPSGTDRCMEVLQKMDTFYDVVVNIQGDEPFIPPAHIDAACRCFSDVSTDIATLVYADRDLEHFNNPNRIKVVRDYNDFALYFSRSPIPFNRGENPIEFFMHIGLYAYRSDVLKKIAQLEPSQLEKTEMLEQLRWLQHGYKIKTCQVDSPAFAIDTPEDLKNLLKSLEK